MTEWDWTSGNQGDFREILSPLPPPSGGRLEGGTARTVFPCVSSPPRLPPSSPPPAGGRYAVLSKGSSFSEIALLR